MLLAPIPLNEEERLADLRALRILDTPPEERFDRLVQLAAHLFDVPIAYIAMVDSDRQWFKAKCGLTTDQTGRDISFCGHTILQDEPLIIRDATQDERFADNPLVTGEPYIRFYVGHRLRGPRGYNVGTLCIADTRPRDLSDKQVETIKRLSAQAEHELNLIGLIEAQRELIQTQRQLVATQERLAAELKEAEIYVRSLLPKKLQSGPVRTDYQFISSSQLGGDMFGYHWLDEKEGERLAMYLLDVCGHGVGASLLSVSVSNMLRHQTLSDVEFDSPAHVLEALNAVFPLNENQGKFITAWYGVYNPQNRRLQYASAGHPPAIALGFSQHPERLGLPNFMIGVMPNGGYTNEQRTMPPGSRLWLYSDGAFEVCSSAGRDLGIDGLARFIAEANDAPERVAYVMQKIREFQEREEFDDDLSLLEFTFE